MWLGLCFAILACFVWGAIFVIPDFLAGFSGIEVVLGRYLSYGILSSFLFFRKGFSKIHSIPKKGWMMALSFSLIANLIYYLGIIAGVRFASASLTVLIIGLAPIVIALYGNWHAREISFKSLILPCVWIGAGMIFINVAEVDWSFSTYSVQQYIYGILGVTAALLAWSWYSVHNARFLKRNPNIPSTEWSNIIGVCTLMWSLLFGVFFAFVLETGIDLSKFSQWTPELGHFLIGIIILGVICSWLGCFLWNRASVYLPVSLMGPFLIFESIFGLLFVYTVDFRLPSLFEVVGVVSMLGGILLSVYIFRRQKYVN